MSYGALLSDESGVPFYIDGTLPLKLIDIKTFTTGNAGGYFFLFPDDGRMRFVFAKANKDGYFYLQRGNLENSDWVLNNSFPSGTVITAYIFGYRVEATIPKWGMAIWNEKNECVIHNETKVLRGVTSLGNPDVDQQSGMYYQTTLNGDWAVAPTITGGATGVINSGGVRPYSNFFYTVAYYNGIQTLIRSHGTVGDSFPGGVSNLVVVNTRCKLNAIDVSKY